MPEPLMSRADFLNLSTEIFDDLRRWVLAAAQYHNLTPEHLGVLEQAAGIIEEQTTLLAGGAGPVGETT
jgi:hypothetical protein